jgi:hypothetical protein
MMHTLRSLPWHVQDRDRDKGKDNGVTKYHKGMLKTENYKYVHNGHGHGVS